MLHLVMAGVSFSFVNIVINVLALSLSLHYASSALANKEMWALVLVAVLTAVLLITLIFIHRLPQCPQQLAFKVH